MEESKRRTRYEFGFVKMPNMLNDNLTDSCEGGVEFWIIANKSKEWRREAGHVRQVCITGFEIGVLGADVVFNGEVRKALDEARDGRQRLGDPLVPVPIDGAVCIGSSGLSIFDINLGEYWRPCLDDLDEQGISIFNAFCFLYGQENVEIVTCLDT